MNVLKLKSDGDWDSSFGCTGVGYGGGEGSLSSMGENGGQRMSGYGGSLRWKKEGETVQGNDKFFFFMLFHA